MMNKLPTDWKPLIRIAIKAVIFFAAINLVYAALNPLDFIGRISLYNIILPGRERLPYGEKPDESYNLNLYNVPAMFASHIISRPKAPDEFRVLLIGDSATWGWFQRNPDTLAAQITAQNLKIGERRVIAYNLGYPIMSLTKDLLLLDEALNYQPDMILWPVTLASFPRDKQLFPPIVQNNAARVQGFIKTYNLKLNVNDSRFVQSDFGARTLIGQRRALADWLRLQTYGFSWAATGIDQVIPAKITLRQSDFEVDTKWENYNDPTNLTNDDLAFDVLAAGVKRAGNVPILIINEPMFVSSGRNSSIRYNAFYPRWAYDAYRLLLGQQAQTNQWRYLDVWDSIAPDEFTDSPVHLTPAGAAQFARRLATVIIDNASQ
jgi:lysophospholipase L1-like esterase